jgi:hypothetical protein
MGLLELPAKANIVSTEKCHACTGMHCLQYIYIYLTFGHWGVPAALDISNIRTLKVKYQVGIQRVGMPGSEPMGVSHWATGSQSCETRISLGHFSI